MATSPISPKSPKSPAGRSGPSAKSEVRKDYIPDSDPKEPVILPLEAGQESEIRSLLRTAFNTGRPLFGEIQRDHTGCYLIVVLLDRAAGKKIQKLLAPPARR